MLNHDQQTFIDYDYYYFLPSSNFFIVREKKMKEIKHRLEQTKGSLMLHCK